MLLDEDRSAYDNAGKGFSPMQISDSQFLAAFDRFKQLIEINSNGHPFETFSDGIAYVWEGYKSRLRTKALHALDVSAWSSNQVGSGHIVERVIAAVELSDVADTNNLVIWQNRWGHANLEHRALIEARHDSALRHDLEKQLLALFLDSGSDGSVFDLLAENTYRKYPLVAYLYFLKDAEKFFPIRPTVFDRAFDELGIEIKTAQNCTWENYANFCEAILTIQEKLLLVANVPNVSPLDAHSFCWMLQKLEIPEEDGRGSTGGHYKSSGRKLNARDTSLIDMRYSILNTVKHARGQSVQRSVKAKELRMSQSELDLHLKALLEQQHDRCALTGLPFQFKGLETDQNMLPSPDRIDSDGHYEAGNIQLVCRFVNFWKRDTDNEEFRQLLMLVRGIEAD